MIRITVDCESYKFRPGLLAPKLVCVSWKDETGREGIIDRQTGIKFVHAILLDPEVLIVGQNVVYDLGVFAAEDPSLLPLIFAALEAGRIKCTSTRQKLIDIATGEFKFYTDNKGNKVKNKFSLQQMVLRYFDVHLKKQDTFRLRYHELDGIPIWKWPSAAKEYPLDDVRWTDKVFLKQEEVCGGPIPTENDQMKAAWALQLMSIWGIRSNPLSVAKVRERLISARAALEVELRKTGIIKTDGSKNQKYIRQLVEEAFKKKGEPVPLTDGGNISCDKDTLLLTNDPLLKLISDHTHTDKMLGTYLPPLVAATKEPFNPNYKVLVTSGRTSCGSGSDDENDSVGNIQNLPRDEDIRSCWEAREGYLLVSSDYVGAELRSWAQVCLKLLGFSVLAEELKQGIDTNLNFAAQRLGMNYKEALRRKEAGDKYIIERRQQAKIAIYGSMGGLGAERFVEYARGFGTILTVEESREIIRDWKDHFQEARPYFKFIADQTGRGSATIVHPITGFVRGDCTFTAAANHYFQHLTAAYAKSATYEVVKESWTGASTDGEYDGINRFSPLYGARPNLFVHDQIVSEMRPEIIHDGGYRQALIMQREADKLIPDVPNPVEPTVSKKWDKNAKTKLINGKLVEWIPS